MSTPHERPGRAAPPRAHVFAALLTVYLVWSSTYLALRRVVTALPPLGSGALRFAAAGLGLLLVQRLRGAPGPARRDWPAAARSGLLLFTGSNGLLCLAETRVASSVAAVACATTPLLVAAIGALDGERPRASELAGMLAGVLGVTVLARGAPCSSAGVFLLLAPVAWAAGTVLTRRARVDAPMTFAAQQMLCGAAGLFAASLARGEALPARVPTEALLPFAWLTLFGSLLTYPAYAFVVRHARPSVATSYAYVNPVLALGFGAVLGEEALRSSTLLALLLVVLALLCGATRQRASV